MEIRDVSCEQEKRVKPKKASRQEARGIKSD
jgi:hypothetical protein